MNRREFLRAAAGAATVPGLAIAAGSVAPVRRPGTGTPVRRPDGPSLAERAYGTVVDAVEAGADPDGEAPIDDALEPLLDDDTLVWFPAGTYALESLRVADVERLALQARPGERATLVPSDPATAIDHRFVEFDGVADLSVAGFDLDYRRSGYGGAFRVLGAGEFGLRDLRVRGTMPDADRPETPAAFRVEVTDPDATGVVDGVVAHDGGHDGGNAIGIYVGHRHAGTLAVKDCEIAGFPNNGLYASAPGYDGSEFTGRDGPVHVRGGVYRNNNVANVRLGSTGSTARDVSVVVDREPPSHAGTVNARGIRLRNKRGQVIENCDVTLGPEAGYGFGGLVVHPEAGHATVRNTTIAVDRDDLHAINALADDQRSQRGPVFSDVTVTGDADGGWAVALAGRDDVRFENCTVRQTGRDRNGVSLTNCGNCAIEGGSIAVSGDPVRSRRSSLRTRGLTTRAPTTE